MKRFIYFALCMCTMMVTLSSCGGKDNELVGKWEQVVEQMGAKAVSVYDFKSSGKMSQEMTVKNEEPYINIEGSATCKYTFEDGTITFKFSADDIEFSAFEIEGVSGDYIDTAMEQMKAQMGSMEQKIKNVKIDGDKLTGTFNGQEIEMTRVK